MNASDHSPGMLEHHQSYAACLLMLSVIIHDFFHFVDTDYNTLIHLGYRAYWHYHIIDTKHIDSIQWSTQTKPFLLCW